MGKSSKRTVKWIGRNIMGWLRPAAWMIAAALLLRLSVQAAEASLLQQGIADEVLRFHVLANSDSGEDQRVKYLVRDAVLAWMEDETEQNTVEPASDSSGREQMIHFVEERLEEIEEVADDVLEREGAAYRSRAAVETCRFPERSYGDCTFPAGNYRALRICLGEAEGRNWWCVLYPQLCFTDALHAVVEEDQKQKLQEVLTVEEYDALLQKPAAWRIAFRWF